MRKILNKQIAKSKQIAKHLYRKLQIHTGLQK